MAPPQVSLEVHPSQQPRARLLHGAPSKQPARGRAHPLLCGRFSQPQLRPVSRDTGGVQRRPQFFRGAGVPVHPPGLGAQVPPVPRSPRRRRGRLPLAPRAPLLLGPARNPLCTRALAVGPLWGGGPSRGLRWGLRGGALRGNVPRRKRPQVIALALRCACPRAGGGGQKEPGPLPFYLYLCMLKAKKRQDRDRDIGA